MVKYATYIAALLIVAACSRPSITTHRDAEKTREGRMLGTIAFADGASDNAPKANLYKIHKGYALKANLDQDAKQERKGDLVLSRDKEYRWFAGLQWRFAF